MSYDLSLNVVNVVFFKTKNYEKRDFLLLSIFYCASFLDRIVRFVHILKQKTTRVESSFFNIHFNFRVLLDITFDFFDFLKQKRMESERGSFIFVIFNVRLFLDIIFHFFDFLKQKTTRDERKVIGIYFFCMLFLDRIVGFVDILKQKTTRVESMFNYNVASFLDIMFQLFDFLKQKTTRDESDLLLYVSFFRNEGDI